jgi:hypothetical protein
MNSEVAREPALSLCAAPSQRSAGLLTVDLGESLKVAWKAHCGALSMRPGPAVVGLVQAALKDGTDQTMTSSPVTCTARVGARPDEGRRMERRLTFTPSEDRAIASAAKALGMGYQQWVVAAVRSALARVPAFGQAELEALTCSNRHLAALVIDLASWRRAAGDGELGNRMADLEQLIRTHVERASTVLAHGARRWEIEG